MKKSILKNLVILSFAFGGLFLVGNNVFGMHEMKKEDGDGGGGTITCSQFVGHEATCWSWNQLELKCTWTGYQADACIIL